MRIVRTKRYAKDLKRLGVTADERDALEREIAGNPQTGDVMPGLRGLRKVRFGFGHRGKRGGGRAIYFLIMADETALMIMAYAKNDQEDLTPEQRKAVLQLLKEIDDDEE